MEKTENKVVDLANHVEQYAETWYKLSLLKLTQKSTNVASAGLAAIVIFIFGLFVMLLAGIALCLWLGQLVNNQAVGFLLGAVFFTVVMLVIVMLRKKIVFPYFRDLIIRKLYDNA